MQMPVYALGDDEPDIHDLAYVAPDAVVIGRVTIGPEASIWPGAVLRGDHGTITVGARTSVQDGTIVHCTADYPTVIGADCVVGHNAHLEGCVVEDGCLIGSGSITLNRVVVGAGSIVAAAALVPRGLGGPAAITGGGRARDDQAQRHRRQLDAGIGPALYRDRPRTPQGIAAPQLAVAPDSWPSLSCSRVSSPSSKTTSASLRSSLTAAFVVSSRAESRLR